MQENFGPKGTGPFKKSFKRLLHQQLGPGMQQGTGGRGHCQFNLRKQARCRPQSGSADDESDPGSRYHLSSDFLFNFKGEDIWEDGNED